METRSASTMRQEDVEITAIDTSITVKTVEPDGTCTLDIDMQLTVAKVPCAWNTRESTRAVYPDTLLSSQPDQQETLLSSLIEAENKVNSKHFIVTEHAQEYLRLLNTKDPAYTEKLVKKDNLFYATLDNNRFKSISSDYKIDVVD